MVQVNRPEGYCRSNQAADAAIVEAGDPPAAEAAVLTGQRDDRLGQFVFVVPLDALIPLCSTRLPHQPARPPLAESVFPSMLDGHAAPLGTQ